MTREEILQFVVDNYQVNNGLVVDEQIYIEHLGKTRFGYFIFESEASSGKDNCWFFVDRGQKNQFEHDPEKFKINGVDITTLGINKTKS